MFLIPVGFCQQKAKDLHIICSNCPHVRTLCTGYKSAELRPVQQASWNTRPQKLSRITRPLEAAAVAPSGPASPCCRIGHTGLAQMQFCCSFKTRSISSFSVSKIGLILPKHIIHNFYIEHRPLETKIINFGAIWGNMLDFIRESVQLILIISHYRN